MVGAMVTNERGLSVRVLVVGSSNPGTLSNGVPLSVTSTSITIGWTSTANFFCVKMAIDGQNFFPVRTCPQCAPLPCSKGGDDAVFLTLGVSATHRECQCDQRDGGRPAGADDVLLPDCDWRPGLGPVRPDQPDALDDGRDVVCPYVVLAAC